MEDQEKLRKRQRERLDWTDANGPSRSKSRSVDGEEAPATGGTTVPSAKEVEEFFEILRRMQVAVRYFDKKINVEGGRVGRFSERLREALETGQVKWPAATPTMSEGQEQGVNDGETAAVEEKCRDFDLNNEPEQQIITDITTEP